MSILHMLPHRDIHLALNNPAAKSISFRMFMIQGGPTLPYILAPLDTPGEWTAQILAPHNAPPNRLQSFVDIDFTARTITATALGTNLVILHHHTATEDDYIVIRVQVHDNILAWWFGNQSVTTPVDAQFANTQPSIYAMFSDDAAIGTDRVGDITGHGFVTLTPSNPATFVVDNTNNAGRLRGVAAGNATVNGTFLGLNQSIPVKVEDYAQARNILVPVRAGDLTTTADRHNVLFLSEGFSAAEEAKFDKLVTQTTDELFSKPRHEPYGALSGSFNVFKAFVPSHDRATTCAFQVADTDGPNLKKGMPIPWEFPVSSNLKIYKVSELAERVGLPKRGESRGTAELVALWVSQKLHDFDAARVDDKLADAWKNSHSLGYLEAHDTFFGLMLGGRRADNASSSGPPIATPGADDASPAMLALVRRAYEFFKINAVSRLVTFDPRRYAPERMLSGTESRASAFMDFLRGLHVKSPPNQAIGTEWAPDGTFKRSRGLIAVILNDQMDGGTNMNNNTATATSSNRDVMLAASYLANANANIKVMRRDIPAEISADITGAINTIAHEFGHSFNLGDEYEEFPEPLNFAKEQLNHPGVGSNFFDIYDNIASLEIAFNDPQYLANNSRLIDPAKLKWTVLPRIKLSAQVTNPAQVNAGKIEVTIPVAEVSAWDPIKTAGEEVHLRRIMIAPNGKQLPLSVAPADQLTGLKIDSITATTGKIVLSSAAPFALPPNFPAGSVLFVPRKTAGGAVQTIIEPKVMAELVSSNKPLNSDIAKPDATTVIKLDADFPRDIPNFKPPCQASRLLGAFEGGARWSGLIFRPAGTCKMRSVEGADENGEFCHVCKWLIANRVDPGKHHVIDTRFYPKAKKNE